MRNSLWLIPLVAIAAGALGVGVTAAVTRPALPPSAAPIQGSDMVEPARTDLTDRAAVTLAMTIGPRVTVHLPTAGLVTASHCAPGAEIASGTSTVEVDGAALINLATPRPLWRDLGPGDKGEDVTGLQQELTRLGYTVPLTGIADAATRTALGRLAGDVGAPAIKDRTIRAGAFVWLPATSVSVEDCPLAAGEQAQPGDVLATSTPTVVSAHLVDVPAHALDGARTIEISQVTASADPTGEVVDLAPLAALIAVAQAAGEEAESGATITLPGAWYLTEPVTAWGLPPAALAQVDGSQACVMSDAGPRAVHIVSSSLGRSYVTMTGTAPARVSIHPPQDLTCT